MIGTLVLLSVLRRCLRRLEIEKEGQKVDWLM